MDFGIVLALLLISSSNVVLWRRATPETLRRDIAKALLDLDVRLHTLNQDSEQVRLRDAERSANLGAVLERVEDVCDNIETKRRKVDQIEARRRQREEKVEETPTTRADVIHMARKKARAGGLM